MTDLRAALALLSLLISLAPSASARAAPDAGAQDRTGPYRTAAPWLKGSALEWLRESPYQVDWNNPYLISALSKPVGQCPSHDGEGRVTGSTTVSLLDLWHYLQFDYLNLGIDTEFELRNGSWYYDAATFSAEGEDARRAMAAITHGARKHDGATTLRVTMRDAFDGFVYSDLRLQLSLRRDRAATWRERERTAVPTDARWYQLLSWDSAAQSGTTLVLKETIAFPDERRTYASGGKTTRRLGIKHTTSNHWFAPKTITNLLRLGDTISLPEKGVPVRARTLGVLYDAEGMLCTLAGIQATRAASGNDEVAELLERARHLLYAEPETFRYTP